MHNQTFYTVPELAKQLRITPRTIRLYESKHLLFPDRAGKTRIYTDADKTRLELILRAKRLGFSLAEISELLALFNPEQFSKAQLSQGYGKLLAGIQRLEAQQQDLAQVLAQLLSLHQVWTDTLKQNATTTGRNVL